MTKTLNPPTVVALIGVILVATLYTGGRLTPNDPDDRVLTLATAWGDGTSAPSSAYMQWHTTSGGTHGKVHGGGHWEMLLTARRSDHVILTLATADRVTPGSCSITGLGVDVHGGKRCEIPSLP